MDVDANVAKAPTQLIVTMTCGCACVCMTDINIYIVRVWDDECRHLH